MLFLIMALVSCGRNGEKNVAEKYESQDSKKIDTINENQNYKLDIGDGVKMEFVWIPPGDYQRGSNLSPKKSRDKDDGYLITYEYEYPQHRVRLTEGFWISTTPVTQVQYKRVMGKNPSRFRGENRPVEMVSWNEAVKFTEQLSDKNKGYFRLPTEAEWEFACRAGTKTDYHFGNDVDKLDSYAWYSGNSDQQTLSVGKKKPNGWGLYDMHGNVFEWCSDWFGDYKGKPLSDPKGPDSGISRVLRSSSWNNCYSHSRSAMRFRATPGRRFNNVGFRVVFNLK